MPGTSNEEENCSYEVDDEEIARFFSEAEVSSSEEENQQQQEPVVQPFKKRRAEDDPPRCIESGEFRKIPQDLFRNILKFLSSEDLSSCAKVCQFLRRASSEAPLWRRLYCLRWGSARSENSISSEWKQLYFERDRADVVASMRNAPPEFREYYMQMQIAKRSEAPLPSQAKDDLLVVDQSIADQVNAWRRSRKLVENSAGNHTCSGQTCSYHQIGDVFICEKTGCAHVCGDACCETILDEDYMLVCTVSGRCFDSCVFSSVEDSESNEEPLQVFTEGESGARAYCLGYNGYLFEEACCYAKVI